MPFPKPLSPSDTLAVFHAELARAAVSPESAAAGWKRSLGALALLCALGGPALAATIDVDGSTCTLADAITAANTDAATGGCPAGSGSDTLVLTAGSTHILTTVQDTQDAPTGLPQITSAITIEGNGSTITRASDAPLFRIVAVASTGNLTLGETTVSGGVTVESQFPANAGGGVLNRGTLRLLSSTVVDNVASDGGGVFNDSLASLSLTNSTVSGNLAINDGGGVFNHTEGTLIISNSTVSANLAVGEGGGVRNSGGLTLIQTLVSGNTSPQGREVHNVLGPTGTVASDNFNLFGHDGSAGIVGFTPGATDVVPSQPLTDILDSMLASNSGLTKTHALVFGSPAIDAVPAVSCATVTDQRRVLRPLDGNGDGVPDCDIGAFESVGLAPPPPPPAPPPPSALPPSVCNSPECFPDIIVRGTNVPGLAVPADRVTRVFCTGSACRIRIRCPNLSTLCRNRIEVFVRDRAIRLNNDRDCEPKEIKFAVRVANILPGEVAEVSLRPTSRGRTIIRTSTKKRVTGVMKIRNAVGTAFSSKRVRIGLR